MSQVSFLRSKSPLCPTSLRWSPWSHPVGRMTGMRDKSSISLTTVISLDYSSSSSYAGKWMEAVTSNSEFHVSTFHSLPISPCRKAATSNDFNGSPFRLTTASNPLATSVSLSDTKGTDAITLHDATDALNHRHAKVAVTSNSPLVASVKALIPLHYADNITSVSANYTCLMRSPGDLYPSTFLKRKPQPNQLSHDLPPRSTELLNNQLLMGYSHRARHNAQRQTLTQKKSSKNWPAGFMHWNARFKFFELRQRH